jgi:hypothetical protein
VESEVVAVFVGRGDGRDVAGHGVLSDAVLSSVEDGEEDWDVLYRVAGLGGGGGVGVGGFSADGWVAWAGGVPVDVSGVWPVWSGAGHLAAVVAA